MPHTRYLKSSFFKDEDLATLPFETRLLYAGLWNFADRAGRLEDRGVRLKAEIFPYDNVNIEKSLQQLSQPKNGSKLPYILRYEIENQRYIQIVNWHKHQKPHHTEAESQIPAPPNLNLNYNLNIKGEGSKCEVREPIPISELTVKEKSKLFIDGIWPKYPSKVGRKAAEKHFLSSVKTKEDIKLISSALDNYVNSDRVKRGYIQNGSTWFCNWQDWIDYTDTPSKSKSVKELEDMLDKK